MGKENQPPREKMLSLRVSDEERDQLKQLAARQGKKVADLIRPFVQKLIRSA